MATDRFLFAGFLPARATERRRAIQGLHSIPATLVFFEAPNRVAEALADLATLLGTRSAVVARELTKTFEEYRIGTAPELLAHYTARPAKGEMAFLVRGMSAREWRNRA